MTLEEQTKIIFFSYIYGFIYCGFYKLFITIKIKNKIIKYLLNFIFCLSSVFLYFIMSYKINHVILNYYMIIFFIIGYITCQFVYDYDKS